MTGAAAVVVGLRLGDGGAGALEDTDDAWLLSDEEARIAGVGDAHGQDKVLEGNDIWRASLNKWRLFTGLKYNIPPIYVLP